MFAVDIEAVPTPINDAWLDHRQHRGCHRGVMFGNKNRLSREIVWMTGAAIVRRSS